MATFKAKRLFSDDDNKGGMGTGTKLALGAAALGGGLLAGRAGMFGAGAQKAINSGISKAGQMATSGKAALSNGFKAGKEAGSGIIDKAKDAGAGIMDKAKEVLPNATQVTFSAETGDSKSNRREAAIIGTGLVATGAGILAAKHGKLGKGAKEVYDKAATGLKKSLIPAKSAPKPTPAPRPEIKMWDSKTAKELLKYRKENGVSQREAAKALHKTPTKEFLEANPDWSLGGKTKEVAEKTKKIFDKKKK